MGCHSQHKQTCHGASRCSTCCKLMKALASLTYTLPETLFAPCCKTHSCIPHQSASRPKSVTESL
jgi:hypothetical protein